MLTKAQKKYLKFRYSVEKIVAFILIILLSPVYLFISFLIFIESRGSVFFVQERVGKNLKLFKIFKFRTLFTSYESVSSENSICLKKTTRLGAFLRVSKLDELPQLFNILIGDMSFFGPRPLVQTTINKFIKDFSEIYIIKPGLADFATIKYAFEEKMLNNQDYHNLYYKITLDKIRFSKQYLKNLSCKKDLILLILMLKTILKTLWVAFLQNKKKV